MTPRSPARRLTRLLTVVSLVMSGLYMFVYLYRWEWNRALIAGVFFLGAEIALATSLILARLPLTPAPASPAPPPTVPAGRDPSREPSPFAWMTPVARGEGFGVFVPVLLGAGVILSTLAFAVERVAAAVTNRGTGRPAPMGQPADLRLPPGDYLHRPITATPPATGARPARRLRLAVTAVLSLTAIVVGLVELADATQARPDPPRTGTTTLVLAGEHRAGPSATAALRLWERCRTLLPASLPVSTDSDDRSRITVEVGTVLGPLAERKLKGCVEDATLPGIRGSLVSLERRPSAAPHVAAAI